jgi:hypothetical protein
LFEFKEGDNFNHRNTLVFRGLKFEPDAEIGQKGAFCKGLMLLIAMDGRYFETLTAGGVRCIEKGVLPGL